MTLARKWIPKEQTIMESATVKNTLPQEGTSSLGAGESLPGPSPGCPTFSGGGNLLQDSSIPTTYANTWTTDLSPKVILERIPSLDRLSVECLSDASDSSGGTMETVGSADGRSSPYMGRFFRKRKPDSPVGTQAEGSGSGEEPNTSTRSSTSKRGRGRPPTTGEYVGLAKIKAQYLKLKEDELRLSAEEEVADLATRARLERASKEIAGPVPEEELLCQLNKRILGDVEVILKVAQKSQNLKGTFQKALKEAAASIVAAVRELSSRTTTEELERVQAAYMSLEGRYSKQAEELSELRKELAELRAELAKPHCPEPVPIPAVTESASQPASKRLARTREEFPPLPQPRVSVGKADHTLASSAVVEEIVRAVSLQVGGMFNARFDAIEERLPPEKRIRPPLRADTENAAPPLVQIRPDANQKKNKKKSMAAKEAEVARSQQRSSQPLPAPLEGEWVNVVKRGANKNGKKKKTTPTKLNPAKLVVPRSSAIVLTIQPGAIESGVDYKKVVTVAKEKADVASLEIPFIKVKETATGSRILEIPGAESSEKADRLAENLVVVLDTMFGRGMVHVSRPTKCADLRLIGLDDATTAEEVAAALAAKGGCSVNQIKVGEIRRAPYGSFTAWVRCPVAAAKKVAQEKRLLLGWVAVQVKLLQPRTKRCFRCLETGHVMQRCTREVDRSGQCYRCSKTGHKAAECLAAPYCALCADAKRPAEHRLGSNSCVRSLNKKGKASKKSLGQRQPGHDNVPSASKRPEEEVVMDLTI